MKITACPSPRDTNNELLYIFHPPRGSTPELARPHHGGRGYVQTKIFGMGRSVLFR